MVKNGSGKTVVVEAINGFKPSKISTTILDKITPELDHINKVIEQLITGIKIGYRKISEELDKNYNITTIQLVSIVEEKEITLKYESEGINKLIALCSVLISLYNNEDVCLVVDELDVSIFEYLLGELVKVINENAKRQLIFTSHNLRDFYYRTILLGGQKETLYNKTNDYLLEKL